MSSARTDTCVTQLGRHARPAALILAAVGGGCLMAVAAASSGHPWLGFLALVPLFVAIRVCRPFEALAFGGTWGLSLYLFGTLTLEAAVPQGPAALALLTSIPALYMFLGACLTRWIGFSPFVLAVGWMGVELAFAPLGLRNGLLASTQTDGWLLQVIGQFFGYALVAFVVALISAHVVSALSAVRVTRPGRTYRSRSGNQTTPLVPQTFLCFPLFAVPSTRPRAPPR